MRRSVKEIKGFGAKVARMIRAQNDNDQKMAQISLFDVKAVYDEAYAAQTDSRVFPVLIERAMRLDDAYRAQEGLPLLETAQEHRLSA